MGNPPTMRHGDKWGDGRTDQRTDGDTDKQADGWTDRQVDGQRDDLKRGLEARRTNKMNKGWTKPSYRK